MQFVVVDIETTGLSRYYHQITEIAAVKFNDGKAVDEFVTLVDPRTHIPSFITRLTGIDDRMVKGQPTIEKVMPGFLDFLGDHLFAGHNVSFDYNFLDHASYMTMRKRLSNETLCTCRLARRLLPELPSKSLGSICCHLNIQNHTAHRAKSDVLATASVLEQLLAMLKEKNIQDVDDILRFQKSRVSKPASVLGFRD
jgi:DNA polymerase III epsilon subunit family exonuclease